MKTFGENVKSIYHSHLRTQSPLVVRFKTRPQVSNRIPAPKPGEGWRVGHWWIPLHVQGDPESYSLNIETADIKGQLDGIDTGTWYTLTAWGGQDEPAEMTLEAPEIGPEETPTPAPAATYTPGPGTAETAREALLAVGLIAAEYENLYGRPPTEAELSFASTLMIRAEHTGHPVVDHDQGPIVIPDPDAVPLSDTVRAALVALADAQPFSPEDREAFDLWLDNVNLTDGLRALNRMTRQGP